MKKFIFCFFLLFICANLTVYSLPHGKSSQQKVNGEKTIDGIVAIINEDVVTKTDLVHAITMIKMQAAHAGNPLPPDETLNKQLLDQLINKKLQMQLAKQANITATDKDLDSAIANIAKQNNISSNDL